MAEPHVTSGHSQTIFLVPQFPIQISIIYLDATREDSAVFHLTLFTVSH
jgi:hypothetical protein